MTAFPSPASVVPRRNPQDGINVPGLPLQHPAEPSASSAIRRFRFGGLSHSTQLMKPVSRCHRTLVRLVRPSEYRSRRASDRIGSSLPLVLANGRPLRYSPAEVPGNSDFPGLSSLGLSLLSRARLRRRRHRPGCPGRRLPPLRFRSPSASSRTWAATFPGGYQPPGTCPLSVSHALEALLRPRPAGLVPCRSRPWGSTLQGRYPLAEPCTISGASALLRLADRAAPVSTVSAFRGPWGFPGHQDRLARRRLCCDSPLFRALLPASVRISGPIVQANPGTATLLGFSSLGVSLALLATRPGVHPPTGLASGAHARPEAAPRSLEPAR